MVMKAAGAGRQNGSERLLGHNAAGRNAPKAVGYRVVQPAGRGQRHLGKGLGRWLGD